LAAQPALTHEQLQALDGYWRAANYLPVGQIYLMGNPRLAEPLRPEHIKPRLLGHWSRWKYLGRHRPGRPGSSAGCCGTWPG
jgi:phosphoketolase